MKQTIITAIQVWTEYLGRRVPRNDDLMSTIGYTLAGSIGFIIRYLGDKMTNNKIVLLNIFIIVGIVFFIVPFVAEYFKLTFKTAAFLTWLLSTFNDKLMASLELRIKDKFDNFNKD